MLLISLLVTPVLVSNLGFERYGLWALAGAAIGYLGLFDFGFGNGFVRYLAYYRGQGDAGQFSGVVRIGVLLYTIFGLLVLPPIVLFAYPIAIALGVDPQMQSEAAFLVSGVAFIFVLRSVFSVFRSPR